MDLKKLPIVLFAMYLITPCLCQMPPGAVGLPEIYLGNITFSDDEPLEGETVEIRSTISSNQSIPIANVTVHLLVDQVEVGNITGLELGPEGEESLTFEWIAEKWTHFITLTVDQGARPIPTAMITQTITIEAEPIGDLNTLVLSLSGIALFILIIIITPSMVARIRRR